jgi:AraC-like DNA-binding protein
MFSLSVGGDTLRKARIRATALELIYQAAEVASSAPDDRVIPDDIARSITFIRENESQMPNISDLADFAHLSIPRFKQKFKQTVGIPPAEFIIREKLERSTELLLLTSRTITAIAMDLGFSSSQSFSVVFKKYMGESPLSYRNARK